MTFRDERERARGKKEMIKVVERVSNSTRLYWHEYYTKRCRVVGKQKKKGARKKKRREGWRKKI